MFFSLKFSNIERKLLCNKVERSFVSRDPLARLLNQVGWCAFECVQLLSDVKQLTAISSLFFQFHRFKGNKVIEFQIDKKFFFHSFIINIVNHIRFIGDEVLSS